MRSFTDFTLHQALLREMECNTNKEIKSVNENLGRDNFQDLGIDGIKIMSHDVCDYRRGLDW
jgi:hypothetical protein